ncbi:MAG: copper amine oxidase N-terminal domain-containing protein, partial [Clostridia bacterium]
TTLVPLRVITEAFGAHVTWVGETKEIILEYPDVNITLQIGNINATVNTHTETLPEAPVLSENGVTMVPLRFISETFGATVGYDDATAAITVVKETTSESGTISSSTDLPRIGDSYWGWSMMNPTGMRMTDRYFDGCYTVFKDEASKLSLHIYDVSEYEGSYYDDNFNYFKSLLSGYTFSKAEKSTDANKNKCFRITARNKEECVDIYSVCKGDYSYEVVFSTEAGNNDAMATIETIINSFKLEFALDEDEKAITYDLSNVGEDGFRTVKDEELKISVKVPATCRDNNPKELNSIEIVGDKSDDCTRIAIGVYSKSETVTSNILANSDREHNEKYYNPELCTVSKVCEYKANDVGENAYYYWITSNGLYSGDYVMYDVFFEKGDYVYNISVKVLKGDTDLFDKVMSTLEVEELDRETTGTFIRADRDTTPKNVSTSKWTLELSSDWTSLTETTASSGAYMNLYTGALISVTCGEGDDIKQKDMPEIVEYYSNMLKKEGFGLSKSVTKEKLGGHEFYTFQRYHEDEESGLKTYTTVYMILAGGNLYIFTLTEDEEFANHTVYEEVKTILSSFTTK